MKNTRLLLLAASALSLTGLAACARSEPEEVVTPNGGDEAYAAPAPTPAADRTDEPMLPPPPSVDANAADETPPETAASPDEQMLDDASATGMTARASRGEEDETETPAAENMRSE